MKLVNKDLTRETVRICVTGTQIYARILSKNASHKWEVTTFFKDHGFEVDKELVESTIQYIIRIWSLKSPKIIIE